MTTYLFHVKPQNGSSYIEQYHNTEQYWKNVAEMQAIIEARVPDGAVVSFYGTN